MTLYHVKHSDKQVHNSYYDIDEDTHLRDFAVDQREGWLENIKKNIRNNEIL